MLYFTVEVLLMLRKGTGRVLAFSAVKCSLRPHTERLVCTGWYSELPTLDLLVLAARAGLIFAKNML